MSPAHRDLGAGHLTALELAPPDLVSAAAQAGFDLVGVRAETPSGAERRWPLTVGSPLLLDTVRRLRETGVRVLDIEVATLTPRTRLADHDRVLEVGVRLGARFLNVLCDDPDLSRAAENFAALAERAALYDIRPCLEAMPYKQVNSLAKSAGVTRRGRGGVLLDALHLQRCGDAVEDVRALESELLTYLQLCDAPREAPGDLTVPTGLPRGQACGPNPAQIESLTARRTPGDGELPLTALLNATTGHPVSVEAPNLELLRGLGPQRALRQQHDAARALLASAEAALPSA